MKTIKPFFFLVLFISPILSCDELEELLEQEIDIQTSFTRILSIESPMTSNPDEAVSFESAFATYDFESDPDVAELIANPSEITKIKITEVRYLFQDVVGNTDAQVEGDFEVITGPTGSTQRFESVVTHLATADETNRLFFLDGDLDIFYSRVGNSFDASVSKDYYANVLTLYRKLSKKYGFIQIDASLDKKAINDLIFNYLKHYLN